MQRLYVGGLSHTITEKDLKDRFGKFGNVKDVELRTRRDDEGEESVHNNRSLKKESKLGLCLCCILYFDTF